MVHTRGVHICIGAYVHSYIDEKMVMITEIMIYAHSSITIKSSLRSFSQPFRGEPLFPSTSAKTEWESQVQAKQTWQFLFSFESCVRFQPLIFGYLCSGGHSRTPVTLNGPVHSCWKLCRHLPLAWQKTDSLYETVLTDVSLPVSECVLGRLRRGWNTGRAWCK